MKQIFGLQCNGFARGFAAVLLGAVLTVPVANADEEVVQSAGGVSYVSGGVGDESVDQLNALARDFNLKLVFALKSGSYLSGVDVAIADAKGKSVLDTNSGGPWLMAKLPAGNYKIVATFSDKAETRSVSVGADKLKTVDFRWATE